MNDRLEVLAATVDLLADGAAQAESLVLDDPVTDDNLPGALGILDVLTVTAQIVAATKKLLATQVGNRLGPDKAVIDGKPRKRHADMSRTDWDHEALLRCVLDSRRIDTDTGEVLDETPTDKLAHVYGLRGYQAKVGVLRDRGIDPDEFASTEFRGWSISDR